MTTVGRFPPPYAPIETLRNEDVAEVEQRTGHAFGKDYRYYVARMRDGKEWRLRSVTSVLGCLNKEALIQWAVDQAVEEVRARLTFDERGLCTITPAVLDAVLGDARKAHYRTKMEAADLGTRAHELIEDFLRLGDWPSLDAEEPRVQNCIDLFRSWWETQSLAVINTELMVYDVTRGYGGQLDFLAADTTGQPVLVDWKTSKSLYWNYDLQAVAYAKALQQMGRGAPRSITIVRIGREDAEFETRDIPRSEWARLRDLFYACIPLSDAMREAEADRRKRLARAAREEAA